LVPSIFTSRLLTEDLALECIKGIRRRCIRGSPVAKSRLNYCRVRHNSVHLSINSRRVSKMQCGQVLAVQRSFMHLTTRYRTNKYYDQKAGKLDRGQTFHSNKPCHNSNPSKVHKLYKIRKEVPDEIIVCSLETRATNLWDYSNSIRPIIVISR
jgi:hypothetical protein